MEIESIKIRRLGKETDPYAEVILEVKVDGIWFELGRERINSSFCTAWNVGCYQVSNCPRCNADGKVIAGSACGSCRDGKIFGVGQGA